MNIIFLPVFSTLYFFNHIKSASVPLKNKNLNNFIYYSEKKLFE